MNLLEESRRKAVDQRGDDPRCRKVPRVCRVERLSPWKYERPWLRFVSRRPHWPPAADVEGRLAGRQGQELVRGGVPGACAEVSRREEL